MCIYRYYKQPDVLKKTVPFLSEEACYTVGIPAWRGNHMCKRILSATVFIQEETHIMAFSSGINILYGQNGEDVLLTLAGIFGGKSIRSFKAELQWQEGVTIFVSGEDGHVFVDGINKERGNTAQLMKDFHKHRFLNFRNQTHILDGSQLPAGTSGAGDLLLQKLEDAPKQKDDRPLFICNFLERLDEAVDLRPIFEALNATGRQVFIAVPHYYKMEEMNYGTAIHTL